MIDSRLRVVTGKTRGTSFSGRRLVLGCGMLLGALFTHGFGHASDGSAGGSPVLSPTPSASAPQKRRCPSEMVGVKSFCVDRGEASMVDRDTGEKLSPYYPPQARL